MESTEGKSGSTLSFYITGLTYVLFNLRIGADPLSSVLATLKQIGITAPYLIAFTFAVVSVLQYAAGGEKVPWPQRFRLFFTIGIFAGLVYGIYDYTGGGTLPQNTQEQGVIPVVQK
jgi:hypothetical protein